jgi:hypothetical protein
MTIITTIKTKTICLILSLLLIFVLIPNSKAPIARAKTTVEQKCYAPTGTSEPLSFSNSKFKTNWTGVYQCTFDKFNPALGKLNQIDFFLTGNVLANLMVENEDNATTTPIPVSSTAQANLYLKNPFNTGLNLLTAVPQKVIEATLGQYDGITDYSGTSGRSDLSVTATDTVSTFINQDPALGDFIGTDTYTTPVSTSGESKCSGGGNLTCRSQTYSNGVITVSYEYDPSLPANPGSYTNKTVNGNIDLSSALNGNNVDNLTISKFNIKTLPDITVGILYYLDSTGTPVAITTPISLTPDQAKTLYFVPAVGSEGSNADFSYSISVLDSNGDDLEGTPAVIALDLIQNPPLPPVVPIPAPTSTSSLTSLSSSVVTSPVSNPTQPQQVITITNQSKSSSLNTSSTANEFVVAVQSNQQDNNCNITGSILNQIDVTSCFSGIDQVDHFYIKNLKTGSSCGDFYIVKNNGDKIKITNGQDLVLDNSSIVFIPNSSSCSSCDVGLGFDAVDKQGSVIKTKTLTINFSDCGVYGGIGGGLENTVRTGGVVNMIKENIMLIGVLVLSILFFFSTLSQSGFNKKSNSK